MFAQGRAAGGSQGARARSPYPPPAYDFLASGHSCAPGGSALCKDKVQCPGGQAPWRGGWGSALRPQPPWALCGEPMWGAACGGCLGSVAVPTRVRSQAKSADKQGSSWPPCFVCVCVSPALFAGRARFSVSVETHTFHKARDPEAPQPALPGPPPGPGPAAPLPPLLFETPGGGWASPARAAPPLGGTGAPGKAGRGRVSGRPRVGEPAPTPRSSTAARGRPGVRRARAGGPLGQLRLHGAPRPPEPPPPMKAEPGPRGLAAAASRLLRGKRPGAHRGPGGRQPPSHKQDL